MKTKKYNNLKMMLLAMLVLSITGCERELSEDATFATYPTTGQVFIDAFSGGLQYFPFLGSKQDAFTVDFTEKYSGSSSMRFDVPVFGVNYAGANFPSTGARDLRGYDALTFWAKGTQGASINEIGFGLDGVTDENLYRVTKNNLAITTNWVKYTIPIPDPSKLNAETGLFWYAEGAQNENDEGGYTFWIDELKYEKLGNLGQPQPKILNGEDVIEQVFKGTTVNLADKALTQTFNLASGVNQTLNAAPSYFTFSSTDNDVARVSELGIVSIVGNGTAKITAVMGGVKALGSLTIETLGQFQFAPTPILDPSRVISIFSDAYTNVNVDFYNGFWEPFQTTLSADFTLDGNSVLSYTDFNFVGTQFANPTVNATDKSTLHINMLIPADIPADLDFLITIKDFGADAAEGGSDDRSQQVFFYASDFEANTWSTFEIPITLTNRSNIGLIIYENINNPSTSSIESFYLDNVYFHN